MTEEVIYKLRHQKGRTAGDDGGLETTKDVRPVWEDIRKMQTPVTVTNNWCDKLYNILAVHAKYSIFFTHFTPKNFHQYKCITLGFIHYYEDNQNCQFTKKKDLSFLG